MKRFFIIAIILTGLYSCDDKNKQAIVPDPEPAWGADSGIATINDSVIWTANASRNASINDTIISMTLDVNRQLSNGEVYPYENFSFKMLRKKMLVQRLDSFDNAPLQNFTSPEVKFFTKVDYDALNEIFKVHQADSLNNWIQIKEQRNNYKEIKGVFSVTLIKTQQGTDRLYPDTLRVRNGYFRVTIKD